MQSCKCKGTAVQGWSTDIPAKLQRPPLTKSCLDVSAKFRVLDKTFKQVLPDKVCSIGSTVSCIITVSVLALGHACHKVAEMLTIKHSKTSNDLSSSGVLLELQLRSS